MVEFNDLQNQQWKALDRAVYLGMTASEAQEFERRARRVDELQQAFQKLTSHKNPQNP